MFQRSIALLALALPLHVGAAPAPAAAALPAATPACATPAQKVDEQGFVTIGGIEQWVTVKGDRCGNPIVLFVHGGPGNPLSPYGDAMFGAWARDFTLVHWDQRGAGRTFGRNPTGDDVPLTVSQLVSDGIEVTAYVAQRFGQQKVILWGSSWGSALAVHMVQARPALFHAYLGTSQIVDEGENGVQSYAQLLQRVQAAQDKEALTVLQAVGSPPWTDPRSFGKVRRVIRRYEAQRTVPAPKAWWQPPALYTTPQAQADYEAGEDYSFLQFVGLKGDGMASTINLRKLGTEFQVPLFFVQGAEDLLTTPDVTQRYVDSLKAPVKALVLLPQVGHDPNPPMLDAQYRLLRERIAPLIR
ncbi:alpha/beta hydrolase [Pelomonas sp. APW6]|uniref:Proline iminopeptidase n=1 Tax=Roseateles subflavus TaxID=3053353 RepID=A0ABT7LBW2_9BURK|nr:alpha/beta hydrolase [Pelomonas sp. APW6]MDL5030347.1 alpha/beta hydrolase [Pelomonas sp. APW6]